MDQLESALYAAVAATPGSTARELTRDLRRAIPHLGRRELNRVLYRDKQSFHHDGGRVPRWYLPEQPVPEPSSRDNVTTISTVPELANASIFPITEDRPGSRAHPGSRTRSGAASDAVDTVANEDGLADASQHDDRPLPPIDWHQRAILSGLYLWQQEAFQQWCEAGGRGVVEAVTGTGKTRLGLEAACQMARRGGATTILVPTIELQRQWKRKLEGLGRELILATVGGDASGDPLVADVTIAVVHSAAKTDLAEGYHRGPQLVVADEVHRYGADTFRLALREGYDYRLGLTATFERDDDAVTTALLPFFHDVVFRYDYSRAVPENIVAPFSLAFLGTELTADDRHEYQRHTRLITAAMSTLKERGLLKESTRNVQTALQRAKSAGGELKRAAIECENHTRQRRNLLSDSLNKELAAAALSPSVKQANGTVVFTQKKTAAENIAERFRHDGVPSAAVYSGLNSDERHDSLDRLEDGRLQALCAPRILDEGIDIPNIDLGIVVSASRGRRQMIQRLGRVIRRKDDGHHARFVILYAKGTIEDPAQGAQEQFTQMVEDAAARTELLDPGWTLEEVEQALELPVTDPAEEQHADLETRDEYLDHHEPADQHPDRHESAEDDGERCPSANHVAHSNTELARLNAEIDRLLSELDDDWPDPAAAVDAATHGGVGVDKADTVPERDPSPSPPPKDARADAHARAIERHARSDLADVVMSPLLRSQ